MKIFISLLFFFFTASQAYSQSVLPANDVKKAVNKLFEVMESGDRETLSRLLSEDLSYGHSSGLIQSKEAFVDEIIKREPIHLKNIKGREQTVSIVANTAIVRHIFVADGVMPNGEIVPVRIGNCMVWINKEGAWQLLVRQAFKLN
ncbi:hypothetical protein A33Q_1105 [Indibacter alkaliphilus LW1]|uniref:DUF4440 domain-containing protein n=1 Tax=Indibacter alkaliphilus (strain CCUG 57479 / KCTC 22604 / LW1) TaxID=1189612 RepID=S2E1V2_INDAL|nr:nuclear transport factor 2 family protein [Indibacter alkaliphilus]EOZ98451.1 hypothetical protein A33Q_1105 [Indibacter alkaliphilus LW1]